MKKQFQFFQTIPGVGIITVFLLMIPFVAMQITNEVNWSTTDFLLVGILLFSSGLTFVLVTRNSANLIYRIAMGSAIGITLLLVWVNLAVGLIGSGPHAGNLMYIGVLIIVISGIFISRFNAHGMQLTMFGTALSLVVIAVIALLLNMDDYPGSSVTEIIGVNAFFGTLFLISGLLFRHVSLEQSGNSEEKA